MNTVTGYVVVAEAVGSSHDLGLFYTVLDADKFMSSLSTRDWGKARIESREIPLRDVHAAHVPILTPEQQAARAKLISVFTIVGK